MFDDRLEFKAAASRIGFVVFGDLTVSFSKINLNKSCTQEHVKP
jgi:hypothetical protein